MENNDKPIVIGVNFGPINGNVENQQIVYVTNQEPAKAQEQESWSSDADYMSTEEKINLRTPSFYDRSEYEVYREMMDILEPYIQAHGYKIELHRIFNKANFILYCSNDNNEDYSMATGLSKIKNYTQSLRMLTLAVVYCLSLRNEDYGWGMADDCRAGVEEYVYRELTSTHNEWFELLKPIRRRRVDIPVQLVEDKKDKVVESVTSMNRVVQKDELAYYFNANFRGFGQGAIDFFSTLAKNLEQQRSNKEFAIIALMIYRSKAMIHRPATFKAWHRRFCELVGCGYVDYRPAQLKPSEKNRSDFPML